MSVTKKHITGFVLAGGRSSRMGQDKGLMLLNGKEMALSVIEQLVPCVDEVVIVSNRREYKKYGFKVIEDLIKNVGPAGGIYTALKYSCTEHNFFVSCDMPFVTTQSIEYLISRAGDAEITIAAAQAEIHPLFGVYSKSCADKFEHYINRHELKLKNIITHFNHQLIDMSSCSDEQDSLFKNINTPEEFFDSLNKAEVWK